MKTEGRPCLEGPIAVDIDNEENAVWELEHPQ